MTYLLGCLRLNTSPTKLLIFSPKPDPLVFSLVKSNHVLLVALVKRPHIFIDCSFFRHRILCIKITAVSTGYLESNKSHHHSQSTSGHHHFLFRLVSESSVQSFKVLPLSSSVVFKPTVRMIHLKPKSNFATSLLKTSNVLFRTKGEILLQGPTQSPSQTP